MNERLLSEALNDCLDRIAAGQTLESCLLLYPDLAAELRPLLYVGQLPREAHADDGELSLMRSRLDATISNYIAATDFPVQRWQIPPGGTVLSLAAVMSLVIGILLILQNKPTTVTSPTPTPTLTITPSATLTETIVPTITLTNTVSPTGIASPTEMVTPSFTATSTESPTLTHTSTREVVTNTATPTLPANTITQPTACIATQPADWVQYQVRSGDSLSYIATQSGTTTAILEAVNCIEDARFIVVGQILFVPRLWTVENNTATDGGSDIQANSSGAVSDDSDDHSDDADNHSDDHSDDSSNSGSGSDNSGSGSDD